jgi:hypothetical protein
MRPLVGATMSAPRLAVIAAELLRDLQLIGFGPCPECEPEGCVDKGRDDCEVCAGAAFDDRPVNGGDLTELMGRYFTRLHEAEGRALARPVRQEALDLN